MPFLSLQSNFIDQAQAAFLYNYEQKYRHKGPVSLKLPETQSTPNTIYPNWLCCVFINFN
jgi:hypothetical protein